MSYQVLARKWRPKIFSELVGQEHVVQALVNGLDNDRLHHAFLFTGTRGVGKTTIARIFAKALNCETGVKSEPCGKCSACTDIDEGRFIDLIEVDAASRTKVDDTRELLDNVQYAPSRGRYKVYLIDEVHMLSNSSFNALLKTLEEPPPHVKFLLATTDPQKLPVTVLSRCLQFNLKRMPAKQVGPYLAELMAKESVEFEAEAVDLIAQAADGSMRDGLSLLDQAIAHGGGKLVADEVQAMLGTVERRHTLALLDALAEGDADRLWEVTAQLSDFAPNFRTVLADLASTLHRFAIGQAISGSVDLPQDLTAIAEKMSAEDIQLFYEIATHGRRDLDLAPDHQVGFEMTLLRMLAFRPVVDGDSKTPGPTSSGASESRDSSAKQQAQTAAAQLVGSQVGFQASNSDKGSASKAGSAKRAERPAEAITALDAQQGPETPILPSEPEAAKPSRAAGQAESTDESKTKQNADSQVALGDSDLGWANLIGDLGLTGPAGVVAANSTLSRQTHGHYRVMLDQQHEHLHTASTEQKITEALQRFFGQQARVEFTVGRLQSESPARRHDREQNENQQAALAAIENDPVVQALQKDFDATIVAGSVRYLGNL